MTNCTCPNCGHVFDVNPARMMGQKKKTLSEAALLVKREAAKKGGRPIKTSCFSCSSAFVSQDENPCNICKKYSEYTLNNTYNPKGTRLLATKLKDSYQKRDL